MDRLTIAFDGDDTLWRDYCKIVEVKQRFCEIVKPGEPFEAFDNRFENLMRPNLKTYGYGMTGFTLSMVETLARLVPSAPQSTTLQILELGRSLMRQPVEVLNGARETIEQLSQDHDLVLITKGDLFQQEYKVATSGLSRHFKKVLIVSEKTEQTYRDLFGANIQPHTHVMVGNSVRSDVEPALEAGASAVHIPYRGGTWSHEITETPRHPHVHHLDSIDQVPRLIDRVAGQRTHFAQALARGLNRSKPPLKAASTSGNTLA